MDSTAIASTSSPEHPRTLPARAALRDYQARAIDELRDAVRQGARNVLCVAPTGSGKSVLFAEIARQHIARGGRVLVVAHRRELVKQAAGHLAKRHVEPVRVFLGGSSLGPHESAASVAAVQTLATDRWRDRLPAATLVIWDEAHHVIAATFRAVHAAYPHALHLGFTATPERSDGSPLGDVFDRMIVVASIRELTDAGHLVPCDVWAPAEEQTQLAEDAVDAYVDHAAGRRAIVFCANVRHSKDVAARLVEAGVSAEHVDGSTPARDRDAALARFASGTTRVVTNCSLITEGFDVPACKCVIIARGCNSVAMYLQAIGRALRPDGTDSDGGNALVIDLRGAVHRHGMPDADRVFSLDGEAISSASERVDPIRQCLDCGHVFRPRPVCPFCGARVPEPLSPEVRRAALQRISEAHTEDQRKAYFDKLWAEARAKNYKPGWVAVRFKARYGTWPKWREVA